MRQRFVPSSALARYSIIVTLALAASITGLRNGFALDDITLVAANAQVHTLDAAWRLFASSYWPPEHGGSLYRPVVALGYAVQWALADGSPWVFHLTSVALYTGACALVLAFFTLFLPADAALVGAALFAAHPVHVEAVGNVVGQAELIPAVAMVAAWVIFVRSRRAGILGTGAILAITSLFAIATFSKEHALLFPATLVALELLVVSNGAAPTWRDRLRATAPLFVALGVVGVVYVAARVAVLGDLVGEKSFVPVHGVGRVWIMLAAVAEWVRLLAWPARLSADYSPGHFYVAREFTPALIPGVLVLIGAAGLFVALGMGRASTAGARSAARLALVIAAIMLLPVSNLVSVSLVAERTLFMPSVAAMLAIGAAWTMVASTELRPARAWVGTTVTTLVLALSAAGVWRSAVRQTVWRDNVALFTQTALDAPKSYRAQFFLGQLLFESGRRAEGEQRLRLAIELNPIASDVSPLNYLATQYRVAGMCPQSLPLYERAIAADPARPDVRYGLASCLLELGRVAESRQLAEDGVRRGALRVLFLELLAKSDSLRTRG